MEVLCFFFFEEQGCNFDLCLLVFIFFVCFLLIFFFLDLF